MALYRLATLLVEGGDPIFLDIALAGKTELFLDRDLNG